jgi:hypothetical protein
MGENRTQTSDKYNNKYRSWQTNPPLFICGLAHRRYTMLIYIQFRIFKNMVLKFQFL